MTEKETPVFATPYLLFDLHSDIFFVEEMGKESEREFDFSSSLPFDQNQQRHWFIHQI